jgi:hypothetical protein
MLDRLKDLGISRKPEPALLGDHLPVDQDAEFARISFYKPCLDSQFAFNESRHTGGPWQVARSNFAVADDYVGHKTSEVAQAVSLRCSRMLLITRRPCLLQFDPFRVGLGCRITSPWVAPTAIPFDPFTVGALALH